MSYDYETEKQNIFTERGFKMYEDMLEKVQRCLKYSGAFQASHVMGTGDSFTMMAILDLMVENSKIKEVTGPEAMGQDRVFVRYLLSVGGATNDRNV